MHGLFSILMSALLALHALWGCCWHHSHCRAEASPSSHADGMCHRGDSSHHDRQICQEISCVFANLSKVDLVGDVLASGGVSPAIVSCNDFLWDRDLQQRPLFAADALLPPLRLHLLCRVLLI